MTSNIEWTDSPDRQKIITAIDGCEALISIAETEEAKDYLYAIKVVLEEGVNDYG